jgi:hypothetical protein
MINSIFIALATFVAVKYLKYPVVQEVEGRRTRLTGRAVSVILLLIIVPSVLSAIRIVQESNFKIHASRIVEDNKSIGRGFIYDYSVDNTSNPPSVVLFMAGEKLTTADKERLYEDAEKYGITRSQIVFREDAVNSSETVSESEIVRSLLEHSDKQVERLNQTIAKLRDSIAVLNARLGRLDKEKPDSLKAAGL